MMMWWGSAGWGGWLWMSVLMLLFWGGLIWLLITVLQDSGSPDRASQRPVAVPRAAGDVLAERFARGEIDEPEYRSRLLVLHSDPVIAQAGGSGVAR